MAAAKSSHAAHCRGAAARIERNVGIGLAALRGLDRGANQRHRAYGHRLLRELLMRFQI